MSRSRAGGAAMNPSAGVTIDAYAWVDARFELLKKLSSLADRDLALARTARLWLVCYQRRIDVLAPFEVAAVLRVQHLVEAGLAELVADGVRLRGVRRRLDALLAAEAAAIAAAEELERQRQAGREGGKKGGRPRKRPPSEAGQPLSETPRVSGGGKGGVRPEIVDPSGDRDPDGHQETVEGGVGGDPIETPRVSVHTSFIAAFTELCQAANGGAKPSWGAKAGALVRGLLLQHGLDESLRRARNMFTAPPPWPPPPHALETLVRHFDLFAQPYKANGHSNGHRRDRAAEILAQAREAEEQGL